MLNGENNRFWGLGLTELEILQHLITIETFICAGGGVFSFFFFDEVWAKEVTVTVKISTLSDVASNTVLPNPLILFLAGGR